MCTVGLIIEEEKYSGIVFKGAKLQSSTWTKDKFFNPDKIPETGLWMHVPCNILDRHPIIGKHQYKCDNFVIEWEIPEDGIWIA